MSESFKKTHVRFLDGTIFDQTIITSQPNSELLEPIFIWESKS